MIAKISCPTKFHSFNLAEQLAKNELLNTFYTLYYSEKNNLTRFLIKKRFDHEEIPISLVKTFPYYLPFFYYWKDLYKRAAFFDWMVSKILKKNKDYQIFIGWSGMSYLSASQAKRDGKIVLIERGSSHILKQNEILSSEYNLFGINYTIDKRFIEKELKEYELADYIVIPSEFVYNSFIEKGISKNKLYKIPYGVSSFFKPIKNVKDDNIFRILYLGSLTIQKGLQYLFEALEKLPIDSKNFEVWFIGSISAELNDLILRYKKSNWKFFGHINHYELNNFISQCDIAVQPSLQEGLSMVILQILSCGVPVIATTNTGATEIIDENKTGFIISIRDSNAIYDKIMMLYYDRIKMNEMKTNCEKMNHNNFSWDTYGKRYTAFLKNLN